MKTILIILGTLFLMSFFNNCVNIQLSDYNQDTLHANYSGTTEYFTGNDNQFKLDALSSECMEGINLLNINTIIFNNDTLKWSSNDISSDGTGYNLFKINLSNDTLYGEYIGFEKNGIINFDQLQDNIILYRTKDGFSTPFYYLKRSYHQQFFSFISMDPLKNDYINTLESETDTLKYWIINIQFK